MKIEEVKALSDAKLRYMVAKLVGLPQMEEKIDPMEMWDGESVSMDAAMDGRRVPQYCSDLNAMYQAEEFLTGKLAGDYDAMLWIILKEEWHKANRNTTILSSWHATARQKAEVFVMVMGK